jgi:peptidoglycan/LPS O-acetylase OafA/YrhL
LTPRPRIEPLDGLRGLAALAVAFFHFVWALAHAPAGAVKSVAFYGSLGVEVFFVISGLVIPYSLDRAGYRLSDYPVFILRRLARLDPPYLASIVVVILIWCGYNLKPGFGGPSPFADPVGLLLHLGYLNAFFGHQWVNAVYWTLAIEFQYYLGVGLLYPLLASSARGVRLALLCALGLLALTIPGHQFIFQHLPLFLVGIALFQYRAGLASRRECVAVVTGVLALTSYTLGLPSAVAGLVAVLCIQFARLRQGPLVFCGEISYSLYLVHFPVGVAAMRLSQLLGLGWGLRVAAAFASSLLAAWLLYRLVELPSHRLSRRFAYGRGARRARLAARPALP